jgi:hypothetical protein
MRNFGIKVTDGEGFPVGQRGGRLITESKPAGLPSERDLNRSRLDDPRIILFPIAGLASSRLGSAKLPDGTSSVPSGLFVSALKLSQLAQTIIDITAALAWFAFGCLGLLGVALAFAVLGFEVVSAFHQ